MESSSPAGGLCGNLPVSGPQATLAKFCGKSCKNPTKMQTTLQNGIAVHLSIAMRPSLSCGLVDTFVCTLHCQLETPHYKKPLKSTNSH